MSNRDLCLFLRTWWRRPNLVGAVAPSGASLGRLITAELDGGSGPVIELGPGTGVFTQSLLQRGVARQSLVLVEADAGFVARLRQRFPGVRVLCMDATELGRSGGLFGLERARAVVSGLPLLAMPLDKAVRIVKGVFQRHLHAQGCFYQFTYLPRCPLPPLHLEALGLCAERLGSAYANLPPAFVYRLRRRTPTDA